MRSYSKYLDPYIKKVKNREVDVCKDQILMIDNIVIPVLERDDTFLDEEIIEKGLNLQKYFDFELIEWEIFLFALIAGLFIRNNDGSTDIFFNEIRIEVGRGAGKNGFISFLAFFLISPVHGIKGYNIDILANSEDQAKTSFNDVYDVIKFPSKANAAALKSNFSATKEVITCKPTGSTIKYNTSSKRGKDSKRTGCVILDEKHEYTDSVNVNTLTSGLGKMPYGRIIGITTKGHVRGGLLDKEDKQNEHILSEYNPENRTLVFSCHIESEDEWDKPDKWIKANPSINDFPSLRNQIKKEVMDMPYKMDYYPEFMAKRMNYPVGNKDIEVATWDDIMATNVELPNLYGLKCVLGIDYAKTNDFISAVLVFRISEKYAVLQHTWVCAKSRDLPGIKAPLNDWADAGMLDFVNDVEVAPEVITDWIKQNWKSKYRIQSVAIDNYRMTLFNSALKKLGYDAYKKNKDGTRQVTQIRPSNIMQISPVINHVFVKHLWMWGDLPIMRWYTNNTKKIIHSNGNIEYGKIEPIYRKTDGYMALVNAMCISDTLTPVNPDASIQDYNIPVIMI